MFSNVIIEHRKSVIEGYLTDQYQENIKNWLSDKVLAEDLEKIIAVISENYPNSFFAVIKNINVPASKRNQGIGNELIDFFIDKVSDASLIFLEVDMEEDNNFNLIDWYEGFGFENISEAFSLNNNYHIMCLC